MKTLLSLFTLIALSGSAFATETYHYRCEPVGRYADHDYYTTLTLRGKTAAVKTYYVNTVAGETTEEASATYSVADDIVRGRGKLAGYVALNLKKELSGESPSFWYIEPSLENGGERLRTGGMGGRMVTLGQGYTYEWSRCVLQ